MNPSSRSTFGAARFAAAAALVLLSVLGVPAKAAAPDPIAVLPPPAPDPLFTACVAKLAPQAAARGLSAAHFSALTKDLAADPDVLAALDSQPEFSTPIWDYLAGLVDAERVEDGRAVLAAEADLLKRIEARYGVEPETVVAVYGVESDFGRITGKRSLVRSLATLACEGRRQDYFRAELLDLLSLHAAGDVDAAQLTGSWAGAFGQTQFMPSTYRRIAVDFDGDGRRDLVGSTADALASTAAFLKDAGWRAGEPWGFEARVPDAARKLVGERSDRRDIATYANAGVRAIRGGELPHSGQAALIAPGGANGPNFLLLRNFTAIWRYNASVSYALAIALLADQLANKPGLATPWPVDDPGLSRRDRRELQTLLLARGHDIGEADGIIGDKSRRAIVAEQQRLGHASADGRASMRMLTTLRDATPKPDKSPRPETLPTGEGRAESGTDSP